MKIKVTHASKPTDNPLVIRANVLDLLKNDTR